jgi:uncharacterized secreted protein with C-terminal beta-propeller domain
MGKNNIRIKGLFVFSVLVIGLIFGGFLLINNQNGIYSYRVKSFSSYNELFDFLKTNQNSDHYQNFRFDFPLAESDSKNILSGNGDSTDYSDTNVQVEGVDEADIVKTDGIFLYVLSGQNLYIINAYPPGEAVILSNISFDDTRYISGFFINDDYLIVFGSSYNYPILYQAPFIDEEKSGEDASLETSWQVSSSIIKLFDISDKYNPELVKEIEIDGNYYDSRMIGDYVYVVSTEYSYYIFRDQGENYSLNIPEIRIDNDTKKISYDDIYYIDSPEKVDSMTHVISIDLSDLNVNEKSFLIGLSQDMYMSKNNLYLVYTSYDYDDSLNLDFFFSEPQEKTIIHKIQVDDGDIKYIEKTETPGHILNQFSMDEFDGFFRIATTVGSFWSTENPAKNNIFIFDENLKLISSIEGIAEGEQIYSSRFMGEKAYLVTFKNTDPFFTIDLSDPYDPQIIGYLKIPGYSDYLHPYDENHILGIGKDAIESEKGDFAWYQGIKIALFDVSDFENPVEVDKIIIGDRGTESPALHDHKAFLFDKEKELLVIPISLYEISDEIKNQYDEYPGMRGEFTFQGAYVLRLNSNGFEYRDRITHLSEQDKELEEWWYWRDSSDYISRSLYIENTLYTISEDMVKMHNLSDLSLVNSIELI